MTTKVFGNEHFLFLDAIADKEKKYCDFPFTLQKNMRPTAEREFRGGMLILMAA